MGRMGVIRVPRGVPRGVLRGSQESSMMQRRRQPTSDWLIYLRMCLFAHMKRWQGDHWTSQWQGCSAVIVCLSTMRHGSQVNYVHAR